MAALLLQLAQRIAQCAQFGFAFLDRAEPGRTLGPGFVRGRFSVGREGGLFLDRNFSIAAFLRLRRELAFITGDIGPARYNKVHQFSLARGHRLALRFQTFVTLARGRNRESQIVQSLERLFFLSSRALFVGLGGALRSLLFRKFSARSIQFAFEFCDAFAGGLDLLLERFLFGLEAIDLAFGFFFFGLQQRDFVGGSRLRQMRALILRAGFVQLARSNFDIRFRLIAFLDENLADRFVSRSAKLRNKQRGLPELLFRQPPENFFGAARVFQYHRVQIPAERRFDRGNKFRIDVHLRDQRTDDRFSKALRIVQAFENCLRTLGQSFALGIKLTQNL